MVTKGNSSSSALRTVAALHNYEGGVIVHDDIQLCQYLWTQEDGISVKLNDFNRAEIMLWDEEGQKYCRYKNGRGHGDVSVHGLSANCNTVILSHLPYLLFLPVAGTRGVQG